MANVIYRGPVEREPETINLPVASALNPGVAVKSLPASWRHLQTLPAAGSSSEIGASSVRRLLLPTQLTRLVWHIAWRGAGIQRSPGSSSLYGRP